MTEFKKVDAFIFRSVQSDGDAGRLEGFGDDIGGDGGPSLEDPPEHHLDGRMRRGTTWPDESRGKVGIADSSTTRLTRHVVSNIDVVVVVIITTVIVIVVVMS